MSTPTPSTRDASLYRFGRYAFDPKTLELRDVSRVIDLPRKPALLLRMLLESPGAVITREQIQECCWPDIRHGVDPRINAALRQIRRCLGDAANERRFIETLPRRGYRFVAEVQRNGTEIPARTSSRTLWSAIAAAAVIALWIASTSLVSLWKQGAADKSRPELSLSDEFRLTYATARYLLNDGQLDGVTRSSALFNEVVATHPEFASAHAGAASATSWLGDWNSARRFARHALQLEHDNAEAHHALGIVFMFEDWDFRMAERHLRRAAQLDSNEGRYQVNLALALAILGRADDAITVLDHAYKRDPVGPAIHADAGWVYYLARAYQPAVQLCAIAAELKPSAVWAEDCAQNALLESGRSAEAMTRIRAAMKRSGLPLEEVRWPPKATVREQLEAYWEWRVRYLEKRKDRSPYLLAKLYARLGRHERALTALEEAVSANNMAIVAIEIEPAFEPLQAYPHFRRLVRRVESGRSGSRPSEAAPADRS